MIKLEIVNETTFDSVIDLSLASKDKRRVASNAYSLAQTWLYRETHQIFPYAILISQKVVGFLLLFKDKEKQEYLIWRLMIDQAEQNKGYGKEALRQIIAMAREDRDCHWLSASYVIGNHRMRGILESLGFETEGLSGNEVHMKLKVR